MVTPQKKCYPQKKWSKKNWLPQEFWRTLLRGGLLLIFGKWRTLFCTGLLMQFKHYLMYISNDIQYINHLSHDIPCYFFSPHMSISEIPIISLPDSTAGDEAIHLEGDDWIPRQGRRRAGDGGDGSSCYDLIVVAVQEGILGAEPGVGLGLRWAGIWLYHNIYIYIYILII